MFDTALIESGVHQSDHGTVRKLPYALGFHAAVIGALVYSALVSTAEPPEPAIPIAFPSSFTGGPPLPPAGGPAPIQAALPASRVKVDVPTVRMPEEIPPVMPSDPQPETSSASGTDSGDPGGGEPGGQRDGVIGGMPFSLGSGEDAGVEGGTSGDQIHQPGVGGVTVPELIERIEPLYPEAARKLRQEGAVLLEAIITTSGIVDQVRIVGSAGPLLDAAAVSAVRRWRYRPATLNGRAVAVFLAVKVRFGLNG
jgi:protein TonB